MEDTSEQRCSYKHQARRYPVVESKRILEVKDGEKKADELAQCDDQGHQERGTFGCQDEHTRDAEESASK